METATTIEILRSTISNPITRRIISGFGFCEKCGKHSIKIALELYVGERKKSMS